MRRNKSRKTAPRHGSNIINAEVAAGTMMPAMTFAELCDQYNDENGSLHAAGRPMLRFIMQQGIKRRVEEDGTIIETPKWRVVDDTLRSSSNEMTRTAESIHLPAFQAPGLMA